MDFKIHFMKKALLGYCCLLLVFNVSAQKTNWYINANAGLFSFSGLSAVNTSFINYSSDLNITYTNNPYGAKSGFGYGLSGRVQHIYFKHFIAGIDAGYEKQSSRVLINGISGYTPGTTKDGHTNIDYKFINVFPFAGYRINMQKVHLDITGGVDLAYCLSAKENGSATATDGTIFTTNTDRKTITTDIRPRIQGTCSYHKAGIYIAYSHGFGNYMDGYIGGINEAYARLLRFGISYQLK